MTLVASIELLRAASIGVLATLGRASLEGAVVAALVWLACRTLPALPAGVRAWLWWLVALKFLLGVLPAPVVPLPWLPATSSSWTTTHAVERLPLPSVPPGLPESPTRGDSSVVSAPPAASARPISIPYASLWPLALAAAWFVIVALHGLGLLRAWRDARELVDRAEPVAAGIARRALALVRRFALPVMPGVLASRLSAVPLLTGVLRPTIVLPAATLDSLSRTELDLVLGHELAHVRRGDLLWGWVPAVASRLFFFHPLARLATREYLAAREEACDAEVLQTLDAAPADYGQLLVKLGVAPTDDVLAAAGTSPTFASLKRRLVMLDRSRTPASRWWWTLAGATAVLVPLTLVAQPVPTAATATAPSRADAGRAPRTSADQRVATPALAALPVPPEPPAPPPPPPGATSAEQDEIPPSPPVPPAPDAPPAPPAPPEPLPADAQERRHEGRRHIQSPWVLLEPGDRNVMSGSSADREDAERNRTSGDDTLLWFRYQGTPYVTRDAATIAAVRQAFEPVTAAGRTMGELGRHQGSIGSEQGALGAKQGELGAKQAALAAEMTRAVAERVAALSERMAAGRQQAQAADQQRDKDIERRREMLDTQMKALADQQRVLGEQMRALGERMRAEGGVLRQAGRALQDALAQADAQATSVFGAAVSSGKATRAK